MSVMPQLLVTARLTLRRLRAEHLAAVHALFSSDGHTIGDGPVRDRAETANWLARREMRYRAQGLCWYGLWTADDTFVGNCGVFLGDRCDDEPEIGYEVHTAFRGHGFAHEAARVVTDATHQAGHARVWATIRPANVVSVHIVATIGYRFVYRRVDAKGDLDFYLSSGTD